MSEEELKAPVPDTAGGGPAPEPGSRFARVVERRLWRHLFSAVVSVFIVAIILIVSYYRGDSIFGTATSPRTYLIPYVTNLAGILLFILNTSRKKREDWKLRDYWGDYCFRIAESFAYLFIVLWAWNKASSGGTVTTEIGPNIVGFLVGLFITRVERAMEALGDKFEEMLMAILPRSVRYMTAEEKRRQQLKMVYKIDEVTTQYETMRTQIDDPAARVKLDQLVSEARKSARGEDPDKLGEVVEELTRTFDDVRQSTGEVRVSIDEFLGKVIGEERKGG